jgi:hypothetical protein
MQIFNIFSWLIARKTVPLQADYYQGNKKRLIHSALWNSFGRDPQGYMMKS